MYLLRRRTFYFFLLLYSVLIVLIMYITLNGISEFNSVYNLKETLNENYLYSYNYKVEKHYLNYDGKRILYKWDCIKVDGEYKNVLLTTKDGIENGIPYVNGNVIFFQKIKEDIQLNEYILLDGKKYEIENYFFNYPVNIDYIYIFEDEEYILQNYDLIVYDFVAKTLSRNELFSDNVICCNGKTLKNNISNNINVSRTLLLIISFIPIVISSAILFYLILYFLEREKDFVLINYIYYMSKKKIINEYRYILGLSLFSINLLLNVILFFICRVQDYKYLYLIAVCYSLIEFLFISFAVKNKINKYLKPNLWRYYDDLY